MTSLAALLNDPVLGLCGLEQYVYARVYPRRAPLSDELPKKFRPYCWKDCRIALARMPDVLLLWNRLRAALPVAPDNAPLMPVHPLMYSKRVLHERAIPTATSRTFILPKRGIYAKTSLSLRVSSTVRTLDWKALQQSREVSLLVRGLEELSGRNIEFIDDAAGIYSSDLGFGAIIRDVPCALPGTCIAPLHALYATDFRAPENEPLVRQLARCRGRSTLDYIIEDVLPQYLRAFTTILDFTGLAISMHGQNVLGRFHRDGSLAGVLVRDFNGLRAVEELRLRRGLSPLRHIPTYSGAVGESLLSLAYDFFIGYLFLDELAALLVEEGVCRHAFCKQVREVFHQEVGGVLTLPKRVYYLKGAYPDRKLVQHADAPKYR